MNLECINLNFVAKQKNIRLFLEQALLFCTENDFSDTNLKDVSMEICEQMGMIKSSAYVNDILSVCLVGKVDAKKLKAAKIYEELEKMIGFQSPSLKKAMLQWVVISAISFGSLCGIFSAFNLAFL